MKNRIPPQSSRLLALAMASLLALVLLHPQKTTEHLVSHWRASFTAKQDQQAHYPSRPAPQAINTDMLPTGLFVLDVAEGLYPDERAPLAEDLQRALGYVVARFGSRPASSFTATLVQDDSCALHGVAYTDVRLTQVYTCPSISRDRAVAIMAHEFVHQLEQDRYGADHLSADLILSEGMATWAAGGYWLNGKPNFRSYVREQRQAGSFYPLATSYEGLGTAAMDTLYYEWASFVEFLLGTYGREQFDRLYRSGGGSPGAAAYAAVYRKGLEVLEAEWLVWLER